MLAALAALLWFVIRVTPKPSRAAYPCQRAAAPIALGLLGYAASAGVIGVALRTMQRALRQSRKLVAASALSCAVLMVGAGSKLGADDARAAPTGTFSPSDGPNVPIGTARGIMPGRVAWVHDPTAVSYAGSGNWWNNSYNDQKAISAMVADSVRLVANDRDLHGAWDAIFRHNNKQRGRGDVGYRAGERIVIKVNANNNGNTSKTDTSPHMVYALLDELVNLVGVAQGSITVYDKMRPSGVTTIESRCKTAFPGVNYNRLGGVVPNALQYSASGIDSRARELPVEVVDATYMINFAVLKRHTVISSNWRDSDGQTGVTLGFKNHCGTLTICSALHEKMRDWNEANGNYNPLVDLMGSKHIGPKTVLHLIDGLYSADKHNAAPRKWSLAPFAGRYPASLFASQDPVALDSVALDFLRAEMPLVANADNYLHEAALLPSPPSGTKYAPDGTPLQSLGVHEHWNSSAKKQYSRNLGTGTGIELVTRAALSVDPGPADAGTVDSAMTDGSPVEVPSAPDAAVADGGVSPDPISPPAEDETSSEAGCGGAQITSVRAAGDGALVALALGFFAIGRRRRGR